MSVDWGRREHSGDSVSTPDFRRPQLHGRICCGIAVRVCHHLTSAGAGQGVFVTGAVASGALEEAGTASEMDAGEFSGEAATGSTRLR